MRINRQKYLGPTKEQRISPNDIKATVSVPNCLEDIGLHDEMEEFLYETSCRNLPHKAMERGACPGTHEEPSAV